MFSREAIDDELLRTAVSPRATEADALNAVRLLGASVNPDEKALASIVVHGRLTAAKLALDYIFQLFGENAEQLERIVAELKRVVTANHPNFDLVKGL